MRRRFRTTETHEVISGVPVNVVVPTGGIAPHNANRVLIALHGGAFIWGSGSGGLVEAVPIAAVGGYKVVSVDYRLAPEHRFPAGSQDVESVYRTLLKSYRPENIGIFGCSAGGMLTAQSTAWIIDKGLPRPGAIGTFCGTGLPMDGDSVTMGQIATGQAPMTNAGVGGDMLKYVSAAKADDPLAYPGNVPAMTKRFPPTLLIGGGRDFALSGLTTMDRRLRAAGVDSELVVFDGMSHAFFMDADLPESAEVFSTVAQFFDRHLGRKAFR